MAKLATQGHSQRCEGSAEAAMAPPPRLRVTFEPELVQGKTGTHGAPCLHAEPRIRGLLQLWYLPRALFVEERGRTARVGLSATSILHQPLFLPSRACPPGFRDAGSTQCWYQIPKDDPPKHVSGLARRARLHDLASLRRPLTCTAQTHSAPCRPHAPPPCYNPFAARSRILPQRRQRHQPRPRDGRIRRAPLAGRCHSS